MLALLAMLRAADAAHARDLRFGATVIGALCVVHRSVRRPEKPTAAAAIRHDRAVRRLMSSASAVLPMRFGITVTDAGELAPLLGDQAGAIVERLASVDGCVQMTLRVYRGAGRTQAPAAGGPGARYLARRGAEAAFVASARAELGDAVADEVVERHAVEPLLASVYHLVPREQAVAYRAGIRRVARAHPEVRVTASGPWAPYAFCAVG